MEKDTERLDNNQIKGSFDQNEIEQILKIAFESTPYERFLWLKSSLDLSKDNI